MKAAKPGRRGGITIGLPPIWGRGGARI